MLIWGYIPHENMASRVVSTKLSEEEYGKLVGLCSASGYTVSKILKRAILERMNDQSKPEKVTQNTEAAQTSGSRKRQTQKSSTGQEDKFLYY